MPRRNRDVSRLEAADVDLIVYGGCSNDEAVPNSASGVQVEIGATNAAAMDLNTACTSLEPGQHELILLAFQCEEWIDSRRPPRRERRRQRGHATQDTRDESE